MGWECGLIQPANRWLAAIATGGAIVMVQSDWRMCSKCRSLFFNGDATGRRGACPADGHNHAAGDLSFVLHHDVPESSQAQGGWRFCGKCFALFFDGFPSKGVCDADLGPHAAAGFVFVVSHDVTGGPREQTNWRFCRNCLVMFFDGSSDQGSCAHGGGHLADGFTFALAHADPHAQAID